MQKITTSILLATLTLGLAACKDQIPLPPASAGTVPAVTLSANTLPAVTLPAVAPAAGPKSPSDIAAQAEQWKQELIAGKHAGDVCPTEFVTEQSAAWVQNYPFAADGWSGAITHALADFNGDGKNDLLMYFSSVNCSGHNGASPMFAKIVYADGSSSRTNLMIDIRDAVYKAYDEMRRKDSRLVELTRPVTTIGNETFFGQSDFDETTIRYQFGIQGQMPLYAKNSRLTPCNKCAYYNGDYRYDPASKSATLKLSKRAY